jgi:hypothetical protein
MDAPTTPRTWGPFNGRHLTIIIVAIVTGLVMVPTTVWAVATLTNVAVQDPVSGFRASVDSARHLAVSVHAPTQPFTFSEDINDSAYTRVVGPTSLAINLTALALSPKETSPGPGDFYLYANPQPAAQSTCGLLTAGSYTAYHVPGVQTSPVFVQSFTTPLVIPKPAAGQKMCLLALMGSTPHWTVNGSGYLGA